MADTCTRRLDGFNLLGDEAARNTTLDVFSDEALEKLSASFEARYQKNIIRGFEEFGPFVEMANAGLALRQEIIAKNDHLCEAMLFEGQGILKVFETYVDKFGSQLGEKYPIGKVPSELNYHLADLKGTEARLRDFQSDFKRKRAAMYLRFLTTSQLVPQLKDAVDKLYERVFCTTAFQVAFFVTFFSTIEQYQQDNGEGCIAGDLNQDELFTEYLLCLNSFFNPNAAAGLKALLKVFMGNVTGTFGTAEMKITPSNFALRNILLPGELKPDLWDRYRYLILEVWRSSNQKVSAILDTYRQLCRKDVIRLLFKRELDDYCSNKGLDLIDVDHDELERLRRECLTKFQDALKPILELDPTEVAALKDHIRDIHVHPETTAEATSEDIV